MLAADGARHPWVGSLDPRLDFNGGGYLARQKQCFALSEVPGVVGSTHAHQGQSVRHMRPNHISSSGAPFWCPPQCNPGPPLERLAENEDWVHHGGLAAPNFIFSGSGSSDLTRWVQAENESRWKGCPGSSPGSPPVFLDGQDNRLHWEGMGYPGMPKVASRAPQPAMQLRGPCSRGQNISNQEQLGRSVFDGRSVNPMSPDPVCPNESISLTRQPNRHAQFTLIVNVPFSTSRQDLINEFRKYGNVELAMVVCNEEARHPHREWTSTAGYAFVRFSRRGEAFAALQAAMSNQITIKGNRVRADWAKKDSYAKRAFTASAGGSLSGSNNERLSSVESNASAGRSEDVLKFQPHSAGAQNSQRTPFVMPEPSVGVPEESVYKPQLPASRVTGPTNDSDSDETSVDQQISQWMSVLANTGRSFNAETFGHISEVFNRARSDEQRKFIRGLGTLALRLLETKNGTTPDPRTEYRGDGEVPTDCHPDTQLPQSHRFRPMANRSQPRAAARLVPPAGQSGLFDKLSDELVLHPDSRYPECVSVAGLDSTSPHERVSASNRYELRPSYGPLIPREDQSTQHQNHGRRMERPAYHPAPKGLGIAADDISGLLECRLPLRDAGLLNGSFYSTPIGQKGALSCSKDLLMKCAASSPNPSSTTGSTSMQSAYGGSHEAAGSSSNRAQMISLIDRRISPLAMASPDQERILRDLLAEDQWGDILGGMQNEGAVLTGRE